MNKLLIYIPLLIAVPPVGLFLTVADNTLSSATKTIACSIGLPLGVILYAVVYLVLRSAFIPA